MKKDDLKVGDVVLAVKEDTDLFGGFYGEISHYRGIIKSINKFKRKYILSNVTYLEKNIKLDQDLKVSFNEITGKSDVFQLSPEVIFELEDLLGSGYKVMIERNVLTDQIEINAERGEEKYKTVL